MQNDSALTWQVLQKLGKEFKVPLLEMLGSAFQHTEESVFKQIQEREEEVFNNTSSPQDDTFMGSVCEMMRCGVWSEWTECETGPYAFSMQTQTRQCGLSNPLCTYDNNQVRSETRSRPCRSKEFTPPRPPKPSCPSTYTVVNEQFCLKYVSSGMEQLSAEQACVVDGGHLIHVDSMEAKEALHKFLSDIGVESNVIWLNGRREVKSGPFIYTYGDRDTSFVNWSSGEPSNGSIEFCKGSESSPRVMGDRECTNDYASVCEIR